MCAYTHAVALISSCKPHQEVYYGEAAATLNT